MTERRIEYVDLEEIESAPRNPKNHALDEIGQSIDRFGYIEPVVLDERTGKLVAGHGRVEQLGKAKASGQDPPDGVEASGGKWRIPVVRGWASHSDAEAEAYLIASNRLTERGGWDPAMLIETLEAIKDATVQGLEGVGFTDADLADLIKTMGTPPNLDEAADEYGESGEDDFWPILSLRIPPALKARYERVTALHGLNPVEQFTWLVEQGELSNDGEELPEGSPLRVFR